MERRNIILLILSLALFAIPALAQKAETAGQDKLPTVKEILDRYVKAVGGRENIQKIKSRTSSGTVELSPMNLKGTFESAAAPEAKSFVKMTIAGIGDLIEGTDGKTAWAINPIQGSREKAGAELAQAKLTNDFYRDLKLMKLFPKMELKGVEKLTGSDAYVISALAEGVPAETWYFDVKTGLLVRSDLSAVAPEGTQPMSSYYEDYRSVDGVNIPFRIRTQTPGFVITLTTTVVKHGAAVDDSKFIRSKQ